jgi:DNA-binding CsgD family transcriptional regulator
MAIRLGAAEASDARMTWPTTFRLLVREEDREPPLLSHRERESLALAGHGTDQCQIAARLHVTQSTVRTHLSWAFARLGVHSRGEAGARSQLSR